MAAKLSPPALRHATQGKLARIIGSAIRSPAQAGSRRNVDDIAALARNEMLSRFAGHEHGPSNISRENRLEAGEIELNHRLEHTGACVVHQNIQFPELLENLPIGSFHVGFLRHVGNNWQNLKRLSSLGQPSFI